MSMLRLSIRNVTRSKSRTVLTVGSLFFGVMMSLTLGSFLLGVGEGLINETINNRLGALQVHRAGFFAARDRAPLRLSVPADQAFAQKLLAVPNVKAVTPRLQFMGMLSNGSRGVVTMVTGVDVATQPGALPDAFQYVTGAQLTASDTNAALVSNELAIAMELKPTATMILQAQMKAGRDNAMDLEFKSPVLGANPLESKRAVTVPLKWSQELLGMEGEATEWSVAVTNLSQLNDTAAALKQALGTEYEVHTWKELRPTVSEAVAAQRAVLGIISFVFLVIAIFGVANTLLMSVMERTREIGTLLAVGMTRAQVASLFVLEAIATAVSGAGLGLLVSFVIVSIARARGGFAVPLGGPNAGTFQVMPLLLPGAVALAVSAACLGAVLASLYPAWRASKLRPVEALSAP